jgi:organic radical activating enzyme
VIYTDELLETAYVEPASNDVDLRTLEISFDRTCNFGCSYCNPAFSSTWVRDIESNGSYTGLTSDGRNHFTHSHGSSQLYKFGEINPYVEAFFKWWAAGLSTSLQELRITGGEPLMSGDTWRIIEWFKQHNTAMRFALNSNRGAKDELIDRLVDASHNIRHFHLYTSNESVGIQSEYIRDGLVWDNWVSNVERILRDGNLEGFHMMCTVNALCLDTLPEFLEQCLMWKDLCGRDYPTFSLNILRFPSFQSPLVLPDKLRSHYRSKLSDFYKKHKNNKLLHQFELNQLQRLIDYLDVVITPHAGAAEQAVLQQDFKKFYTQYDQRRGKNFTQAFPALADWYNTL